MSPEVKKVYDVSKQDLAGAQKPTKYLEILNSPKYSGPVPAIYFAATVYAQWRSSSRIVES